MICSSEESRDFLEREVGSEQRVDRRLELRCISSSDTAPTPRTHRFAPRTPGIRTAFLQQVESSRSMPTAGTPRSRAARAHASASICVVSAMTTVTAFDLRLREHVIDHGQRARRIVRQHAIEQVA